MKKISILVVQLNPTLKFHQCSTLLARFFCMRTLSPQVPTGCFCVVKTFSVLEHSSGLLSGTIFYACILSVFRKKKKKKQWQQCWKLWTANCTAVGDSTSFDIWQLSWMTSAETRSAHAKGERAPCQKLGTCEGWGGLGFICVYYSKAQLGKPSCWIHFSFHSAFPTLCIRKKICFINIEVLCHVI